MLFAVSLFAQQRHHYGNLAVMQKCACLRCVFIPWVAKKHLGSRLGAELGLLLATILCASSFLLLAFAFLISAQLVPYSGLRRNALIMGSGARATVLRTVAQNSQARLNIVGCLDDAYFGSDMGADNYLGPLSSLPDLLKAKPIDLILIGLPVKSQYENIQWIIGVCESVGVECQYMRDIFFTSRASHQVSPAPSEIAVLGDPPRDLRHNLKRVIDILIAGPMLLLLSPVLLAIAAAIKLTSPGPVFFIQQRYGFNRRIFPMFKFRTMIVGAEKQQPALESANEAFGPVFKLRSDPRVTRVGAILRRTSLDELPQLINVLRGEMSLVGPRPLPLRDVSRFDEAWLLRCLAFQLGLTLAFGKSAAEAIRSSTNG